MSKTVTVEVTVKLPKKLVDTIEALHYFAWSKDEFFEQAVRGYLSSQVSELDFRVMHQLEQKYGKDLFCFNLAPIFEPEEMLKKIMVNTK